MRDAERRMWNKGCGPAQYTGLGLDLVMGGIEPCLMNWVWPAFHIFKSG